MRHTSITGIALVMGVSTLSLGTAAAQTTPPTDSSPLPDATDDDRLAEIVVTAERRVQNLQDVPISATVLDADALASKGVNSAADLQQVAPSLAISTVNRSTFVNIRGVGLAQSAPTSAPGVAFYIDGQLLPHEQFIAQAFYDLGSIEVLRGPQGTLTGQNSTGGAIYIRTPEPKFDGISGYIEQSAGNYDSYKTVGAINLPFSDNVAIRVAGTYDTRDSFTRNIGPSASQPGRGNLIAGRFNLAARSSDDRIHANLRFDAFRGRSDNNAVKRRGDLVSLDPFVIEEDAHSFQNQDGYRIAAEFKFPVTDNIGLRTMSAYQNMKTVDQADGDRTATALPRPPAANVGRVSDGYTKYDTLINEVNLLSTGKGPFSWVIGGFYLDENIDTSVTRDNNNVRDFVSSTSTIATRARNVSKSVFGQVNWYITPKIELLAGARNSWDKQIYDRNIVASVVQNPATKRGIQKSNEWTGKAGINYHAGASLVYVTASKGYKAGGVNLTVGTPGFLPERNIVYEVGFKTTILDRRLRLNGDVFHSDYKDIQLNSLLNGLPTTQNAASGKAKGAELEITGQFGGLGFNFGGGYLDGEFANTSCINDTNNPAGNRASCPSASSTQADSVVTKGNRLPYSPKWTLNGGVQYAVRAGDTLTLTPRLQWNHQSEQITTPFRSVRTIVPARDVFDARLTADFDNRFRLEAFVMNFTDKTYIASQIQSSSSADGGIIYGAPRTYGLRAVVKFGR
ncbi:TonB-dependent receptor [Sphingomonas sp. Leaf357]|uniref:TonB-dependent receptor n=1 Tax=Sphingomonas sp. Leaf357 TaxID=1736350 RepID=UPI0006F2DABA|nr:TonB-dependent receptor [Sphingomonas sp. Leaf357]KQS03686.1 TonB-dependent receptor [Sphingomonas sp. Leaf357]